MPSEERLEKIYIETYGLAAFLGEVQSYIQKGYVIDLETNDTYPQSFSSLYTATLVLPEQTNATESVLEASSGTPEVADAPVVTRGRKAKTA